MTRRIFLTIAVLPLIVLVGLRSAWAAYACTIDGSVRETCCCPEKSESEQPIEEPQITRACCCDVTSGEAFGAPDVREGDRPGADLAVPASALVVVVVPVLHPTSLHAGVSRARPPPAVPTYLANRTILR